MKLATANSARARYINQIMDFLSGQGEDVALVTSNSCNLPIVEDGEEGVRRRPNVRRPPPRKRRRLRPRRPRKPSKTKGKGYRNVTFSEYFGLDVSRLKETLAIFQSI